MRDGSSLGKAPRLVLEDELPDFPTPTSGFFGFLASPASRNSKNRLIRLWPNQDSEPFLRLRGTSNMVSSRLKPESQIPISEQVQTYRTLNISWSEEQHFFWRHPLAKLCLTSRNKLKMVKLCPKTILHNNSLWTRSCSQLEKKIKLIVDDGERAPGTPQKTNN